MNPGNAQTNSIFLSFGEDTLDFAEALARRLYGDARLSFWFGPWHSLPGAPLQEQMEEALRQSRACAVFIGPGELRGWQTEQMRTAIQTRVEDEPRFRIIPVLAPGVPASRLRELPGFLRRYQAVEFSGPEDEAGFQRLLAGILGIPPIQLEGYIHSKAQVERLELPVSGRFEHGRALVIGIANYPGVRPLPETVLNDARDLSALLSDPAICGYSPANIRLLLDGQASREGMLAALGELASSAGPQDTALLYFSGHGAHVPTSRGERQYLLPYDCSPADPGSAIGGEEMSALLRQVQAGRLLVLFDSCHSGGAGDPKSALSQLKAGLSEDYFQALAQGRGRVVIASSRPEEFSWALDGMRNSLFTHYLLEAMRGECRNLGDGYIRVFDLFRHVADHVPTRARQHPIFKAAAMETDFPVALRLSASAGSAGGL